MAMYLISTRHEPEQCLRALDEELAKGPDVLNKFVYGCKEGDHTGYAIIDAKSKDEALSLVPEFLQDSSCISRVDKFSPNEITSFHAKAA